MERTCSILFLAFILAYCLAHLLITMDWIGSPYPNEYREWANVEAVRDIFSGTLYGTESGDGIYLYGFLYPSVCRIFSDCFGGDFLTNARLLSYVFTLLTAGLGAYVIHRRTGLIVPSTLGFALLLTTNWYNVTGVAQPATLGVFLAMLSLCLSCRGRNCWLWCALTTVLCFYTKAYFAAVFFPLFFSFWLRSCRIAWLYAGSCLLFGLLSVWVVCQFYPAFFVFHVLHHLNASTGSVRHLVMQLGPLLLFFFPLWYLAVCRFRSDGGWRSVDVFGWSSVMFFMIWLRLGMHVGAVFTYAYHLWLPPLCVYALSGVNPSGGRGQRTGMLLCAVFGLYVAGYALNLPRYAPVRDFNSDKFSLAVLQAVPSESIACFSPAMAVYADRHAIPLYNNGQTQYIPTLQTDSRLWRTLLPGTEKVRLRSRTFERGMEDLVHGRSKKLIVTDNFSFIQDSLLLSAGYSRCGKTVVQTGRHKMEVTFWTAADCPE